MVYRGKPSAYCEPCRARRLKCDLRQPSCSQCIRAKKECLGYQDPNALRFFDQTKDVTRKARSRTLARKLDKSPPVGTDEPASPPSLLTTMSWPNSLEDKAWSHVFTYYVGNQANHGMLGFLPELLSARPSDGLLAIVKSLGLACISRIHSLHDARRASNEQYSIALRETNKDLQDPVTAKSDSTLAAVVLLSMYEIIACNEADIVDSWMNHARGAMKLLELRGEEQLKTAAGLEIFTTVRLQVTIANIFFRKNYHASPAIAALSKAARVERAKLGQNTSSKGNPRSSPNQSPRNETSTQKRNTGSPETALSPASSHDGEQPGVSSRPATYENIAPLASTVPAYSYQPIEDFHDLLIRFNELSIMIAATYKKNRYFGNVAPLIDEALQLDADFGSWASTFQTICGYKICRSSSTVYNTGVNFPTHQDEYHIYPSMRLATFWNHYRQSRISLNEMIETMCYGMSEFLEVPEFENIIHQTIARNKQLVNDVCASVPFFFMSDETSFGGVARLPWPLFIAAGCLHSSTYTRNWISEILGVIAKCSGVQQAKVMSLRIKMGYYSVHSGLIPGKPVEELKLIG